MLVFCLFHIFPVASLLCANNTVENWKPVLRLDAILGKNLKRYLKLSQNCTASAMNSTISFLLDNHFYLMQLQVAWIHLLTRVCPYMLSVFWQNYFLRLICWQIWAWLCNVKHSPCYNMVATTAKFCWIFSQIWSCLHASTKYISFHQIIFWAPLFFVLSNHSISLTIYISIYDWNRLKVDLI